MHRTKNNPTNKKVLELPFTYLYVPNFRVLGPIIFFFNRPCPLKAINVKLTFQIQRISKISTLLYSIS